MSITVTIIATDKAISRPKVLAGYSCVSDAADAIADLCTRNGILSNRSGFESMRDALWHAACNAARRSETNAFPIDHLAAALTLLSKKLDADIWMDVSY